MKTISMIGIAAILCVPALAAAQRGGGAGAGGFQRIEVQRIQRVDVQRVDRIDTGRTIDRARDVALRRADPDGGETGTRLHRRPHDPDRPPPHNPRRRWNAAHPSDDSGPSRPAGD